MVLLKDPHLLQLNNDNLYFRKILSSYFFVQILKILFEKFYITINNIFLQFIDIILNVKIQKLNNKKFD